jgi:hypothetical protein
MKMQATIEIPGEATVADVSSVVEFLAGLGEVQKVDLLHLWIRFEFEASDSAPDEMTQGIIDAASVSLPDAIAASDPARLETTAIIRDALGLMERWNEIEIELASRGWSVPRTATVETTLRRRS